MFRRVIVAVIVAAGWALGALPASADYPPVPPKVTTTMVATTVPRKPVTATTVAKKVVRKPAVIVVVREAPVSPRRVLPFTGSSTTVPLTALATASVGLGLTLVCLTRLRWPGHRRRRPHHRRLA